MCAVLALFFSGSGGFAAVVRGSGIDAGVVLFGSSAWIWRGFLRSLLRCSFYCFCASVWSYLMVLRSEHFMVRRGFSGRAICGFALHLSY
jgi:hypothetical protein